VLTVVSQVFGFCTVFYVSLNFSSSQPEEKNSDDDMSGFLTDLDSSFFIWIKV
jgi:hypothetical protein